MTNGPPRAVTTCSTTEGSAMSGSGSHKFAGVFSASGPCEYNACLNFSHDSSYGYIEGYRHAAEILAAHVVSNCRDHDHLVYPLVFLHRHCLEIQLKRIIHLGGHLLELPQCDLGHHRLDKLWADARPILEKTWPGASPEPLEDVASVVHDFAQTDPISTAFRYAADKQGNRSVPELRHINIQTLAEVMARVTECLDGCALGLRSALDDKYEVNEAMRHAHD